MPTLNWSGIFLMIICYNSRGAYCNCPSDTLAVYEVHLETLWHRKDFPKHYPEWRPPASWSKMIGFTHDSTFHVFHKGEQASEALQKFAETARTDLFDQYGQGSLGVLDRYSTPPIGTGVGEAKTLIMGDGNHTKVSMVCKLMPSPDWFIGVDTYDLCPNGRWLELVHLEAGPLDAGTDNGLTFTSPNWPTKPKENIQLITSHHPNHPAGSFFYPQSDALPPIAQFTIKKKKEYSLRDAFDGADGLVSDRRDIYRYEVGDQNFAADASYVKILRDKEDDYSKNMIHDNSRRPQQSTPKKDSTKTPHSSIINQPYRKKLLRTTNEPKFLEVTEPGLITQQRTSTVMPSTVSSEKEATGARSRKGGANGGKHGKKRIPGGDVMSVIDDIVKDYQKEHRQMIRQRKRERKRRRQQLKKIKPPRDCRVSEWSEWGACSKTCGIGEQSRTREITKHAKREGKPCPVLVETTWCGSARECKRDYFNWS